MRIQLPFSKKRKSFIKLCSLGTLALVLVLNSCQLRPETLAGLYGGLIIDADSTRVDVLLMLDTSMHYRLRRTYLDKQNLTVFDEGTWYLEEENVGLIRPGKKDLRYEVDGRYLIPETALAAFPEMPKESLRLYRLDR